jgi:uncharacterized protein YndB with AHSA1/START domain
MKHATLVFQREIGVPVDATFAAYEDIKARTIWGAPSESAILLYDRADFREGGEDHFRCGAKNNPDIHGRTRYLEIIRNARIVSLETIDVVGRRLCASLNTLELTPTAQGTSLLLTVQVTSYVGSEIIHGNEVGHTSSLNNLVSYLEARGAALR